MNPKLVYTGKVEGGKLSIANRKAFIRDVAEMFDGKAVEITVSRKRKQRSTPQNAYYWGIVVPLVREGLRDVSGDPITREETHEFLKARFNAQEILDESTGEVIRLPRSTTGLTPTEFNEFFTDVRKFSQEFLKVYIPEPNEQTAIEF